MNIDVKQKALNLLKDIADYVTQQLTISDLSVNSIVAELVLVFILVITASSLRRGGGE